MFWLGVQNKEMQAQSGPVTASTCISDTHTPPTHRQNIILKHILKSSTYMFMYFGISTTWRICSKTKFRPLITTYI